MLVCDNFFCLEGVGGHDIYLRSCNVIGEHNTMSKCTAWIEKFKVGISIMDDEPHSSQPNDTLNEDNIRKFGIQ